MRKIVLASNNPGKVREIGEILAGLDMEVVPQSDFEVPESLASSVTSEIKLKTGYLSKVAIKIIPYQVHSVIQSEI